MFQALLLTQDQKKTQARLTSLDDEALRQAEPQANVQLRVEYSALNYKDGLAVTGSGPIVRKWPMVPGIDLAGVVESSEDPAWRPGDRVVVTGWGLGEQSWGGLAQKARVRGEWLLRLPEGFSTRRAMAVATAGFTSALAVRALQRHGLQPGDGDVLVTGAAGGVGSVAVALLAHLGYTVVASTGRPQEEGYLRSLGAARIVDRAEFSQPGKPLQSERWAAVVDSLGSQTLANACAATRAGGAVAACGLAQGSDFPVTVMPFILRGVALYGINSVYVSQALREDAWTLLAEHLDPTLLDAMTTEIGLSEVVDFVPGFLSGQVKGRTVVDVNR